MGNTISTGKLIGAFNGTNGEAVYVMFEQTCESNVYPRRPKWNCLLYTSPSPRDKRQSRMPSSA